MLVHALTGNLESAERRLLSQNSWSVSSLALWELSNLQQYGRIELDFGRREFEFTRAITLLRIWPVTLDVARASTWLGFRSDPADEFIAATGVAHNVPLLTRDRKLRASNLVPIAA